jgi:hypothetical protein
VNYLAVVLAVFLPAAWVACSSGTPANGSSAGADTSGESGAPGADAAASCDPKFNPDTMAPGLTKPGNSGALTFVLESIDPTPPVAQYNNWVLKVLDASGAPVADASFPMIKTWMPLHAHGSSIAPTWTSNGDGTYKTSVYLFMPGLWQVTFHAQSGTTTDTVMYTFCVGG